MTFQLDTRYKRVMTQALGAASAPCCNTSNGPPPRGEDLYFIKKFLYELIIEALESLDSLQRSALLRCTAGALYRKGVKRSATEW